MHAKLRDGLLALYERFARHCLDDMHLSDQEANELAHLKRVFGLTDGQASSAVTAIAERLFGGSLEQAMADGRITEDERAKLDGLVDALRLDEAVVQRAYDGAAQARINEWVEQATEDNRVSPEEQAELEAICQSLDVELQLSDESQAALDRMRLYWVIENGDVPVIDVDINLPRTEHCYFTTEAGWYEHRRVTKSVRYAGPTARVKVAKGIYFRAGQVAAQRVTSDELTLIDTGTLYLTNKRLIFRAGRGNKNVRLNKILTFEAFRNGVDIQKDAGKSPFLEFEEDLDLFVVLLDRAIRDAIS